MIRLGLRVCSAMHKDEKEINLASRKLPRRGP